MTKAENIITAVLAHMEDGREYFSADIARVLGVTSQQAQSALTHLRKKDLVHKKSFYGHLCKWTKGGVKPEPVELKTSIAAPIAPPDLRSTLSGYWSDIERRVQLCMSIKRIA